MTKIKICGMRRKEDIEAVNQYHPDACGFIFSKPFKRYVPEEQLKQLKALLDPEIFAFGVFVNEPAETVLECYRKGLIDGVQLHGDEDESFIALLKKEEPQMHVMKAFIIKSEEDIEKAKKCSADLVLLDAGRGSGETFSWNLLKHMNRPYVLAGGLNPENVQNAVNTLHPYGIDTSSGVETEGFKDSEKIRLFIERAREGKTI